MFEVVLYQPEIPPNTGNIIRLCANTGTRLHLIRPLGFRMDDRQLLRAGLDYHEFTSVTLHADFPDFLASRDGARLFAVSTRGETGYDEPDYRPGDCFLFGPETRGLPREIIDARPSGQRLRIPMRDGSRSLNLSNAVAVVVYEALRQQGFCFG